MFRKIYVTADEMLRMREQGMSNHDIAKSLDISVPTVRRYIGRQNERMENLSAFADSKPEPKKNKTPVIPKYDPKPVFEEFDIGEYSIELDRRGQTVRVAGDNEEITLSYSSIPDLVQFLAWAMRERMDVAE